MDKHGVEIHWLNTEEGTGFVGATVQDDGRMALRVGTPTGVLGDYATVTLTAEQVAQLREYLNARQS